MRLNLALVAISISLSLFSCSSGPQISPEARRLLQKAKTLLQEGKFAEAARTGELALETNRMPLPIDTADGIGLEIADLYDRGGSPNDAILILTALLQHLPSSPHEQLLHARASHGLAKLIYRNGQREEARRHAAMAEELARELDQPAMLFDILMLVSLIQEELGDNTAAIRTLTEALVVLPRVDHSPPDLRVIILGKLAYAHAGQDRYPEAEHFASEYFKEAERSGDLSRQVSALSLLGNLKHRQGELREAANNFFGAVRKSSDQLDRPKAMLYLKGGLALLEELKDYDKMQGALLVALDRYNRVFDEPHDKAFLLSTLGEVSIQLGHYDLAQTRLFDAYRIYRDVGSHSEAARVLIHLGKLMKSLYHPGMAFGAFTDAKKHASMAQDADLLAVVHKHLGVLYAQAGSYVEAFEEYEEARKIYHGLGRNDLLYSVEYLIANLYQEMRDEKKTREQVDHLEKYANRDPSLKKDYLH